MPLWIKKHQIVIDAQAFGEGQEHHTLKPVLENIKDKYQRLGISENIFSEGTIVTADTGFANEANMKYLHEDNVNAYIPDNKFRSRDPKFINQKEKYGKRHQKLKKDRVRQVIPSSEFEFDPIKLQCICPAGETGLCDSCKNTNFPCRRSGGRQRSSFQFCAF